MGKTYVFDVLLFVIGTAAAIFLIAACASDYWVGVHGKASVEAGNATSAPVIVTTAATTTAVTSAAPASTTVGTTAQSSTQPTTTPDTTTSLPTVTQPTNVPTNQIQDETIKPSGGIGEIINVKAYFTRGLWNKCVRYEDPLAKVYQLETDCKWYSNKKINAVRAFYVLGFISMAIALLASYVLFCRKSNALGYIAFGSYVVSVFFIVLALSLYAKYEKAPLFKWKWGYALGWFGVILEVFNLVIMCIAKAAFNAYEELHNT